MMNEMLSYLPKGFSIFGLEIAFYAIIILFGALMALFLSSFEARKEGFSWDFFVTVFIIAFPSGIIGARLWYVIAEWQKEFGWDNFAQVFRIWDGGLAIQGGAILGITAGVLVVVFLRRGMNPLQAVDFAVPNILVAQVIGRWGNFFNHEVYGMVVNRSSWSFLPDFILNQMVDNLNNPEFIDVPLFLVEGILNLIGFLFIVHFIFPLCKKLKAYCVGDGLGYYLILYGAVRSILEPMRNPTYIMGTNVGASFVMAIFFIVCGIVLIVTNHVITNFRTKNYSKKGSLK